MVFAHDEIQLAYFAAVCRAAAECLCASLDTEYSVSGPTSYDSLRARRACGFPGVNACLSRAAGVPLDYMRPLFDDYYLYCVSLDGRVALLEEVLERLQGRPEIRAVELDRFNRLQRN